MKRSRKRPRTLDTSPLPPSALRPPPVVIVGIGDDGPAGLGQRAREAVEQAELLAGGRRHLVFFGAHPAEKLCITNNLEDVLSNLAVECGRRRCVVLASGDPCFFGIGPLVAERLGRERVEIIPQACSVALAFARLGLAWEDATVLSAHGRPLAEVVGPAVAAGKLAVLTDDHNTPGAIAAALLHAGMSDRPAFVLEHLGGESERVIQTSLAELPGQEFARLNVLVVGPNPPDPPSLRGRGGTNASTAPSLLGKVAANINTPPSLVGKGAGGLGLFGRPESDFCHVRGQITKAEVRAVALAKLRLPRYGVLWDVGAGSGSVSIEAAALMPGGAIYAIERDPEQLSCMRDNLRRHLASHVRPVVGEAPLALAGLPRPDRVFVGGGGPALQEILEICVARLEGHGGLVANAATLESAIEVQECLTGKGWQAELVQLAVARGRELAGRTRLAALDPVFIVSGWPPHGDTATRRHGDAATRPDDDVGLCTSPGQADRGR